MRMATPKMRWDALNPIEGFACSCRYNFYLMQADNNILIREKT